MDILAFIDEHLAYEQEALRVERLHGKNELGEHDWQEGRVDVLTQLRDEAALRLGAGTSD